MMGRPRALPLLLGLGALLGVAHAQPPTDAQKKQAGDLVKKAIAKSQAGDHQTAIELYLDAYKIVPNPILLSNVGSEYQQDGKPVEALKYFCMYLEKDPAGTNATYATSQAKILQIELGNRDGEVCKPVKEPEPVKPPDPVVATPDPVTPPPAEKPIEPPPRPGRGLRMAGIGMGVAGAATLGVGVFFGLKAKNISDDISAHDPSMPWPADIKQLEADGQAYEDKQVIFLVAGGVVAATGVVLYVVGRSKGHKTEQVSIVPSATPDGMGIAITGGF